jgi:rhodanese-related sulfurtransferase
VPPGTVLLDVREQDEWDAGHAPGAVHIPLGELPDRVGELPGDAQLMVVCHSGGRSARATAWLSQGGYDAVNLDGGMVDWARAGLPVV